MIVINTNPTDVCFSYLYVLCRQTYSGLFCVVVNPYKMLPIYSEKIDLLLKCHKFRIALVLLTGIFNQHDKKNVITAAGDNEMKVPHLVKPNSLTSMYGMYCIYNMIIAYSLASGLNRVSVSSFTQACVF